MKRTILITGSTGGIGFTTARLLAKSGHKVLITGRKEKKGTAAAHSIQKETGNSEVHYLQADLSELQDVLKLVNLVHDEYGSLDVLINNAGGIFKERKETSDGIEQTLALNHIAPFVLTGALLPILKKSKDARIVNVSSGMHHFGKIRRRDLHSRKNYFGWSAYANAKLMNIIWSHYLADELKSEGPMINVADPGVAVSENYEELLGIFGPMAKPWLVPYKAVMNEVFSLEKAAKASVYLATSAEVSGQQGLCIGNRLKPIKSSVASYSKPLAKKVIRITREVLDEVAQKNALNPGRQQSPQ